MKKSYLLIPFTVLLSVSQALAVNAQTCRVVPQSSDIFPKFTPDSGLSARTEQAKAKFIKEGYTVPYNSPEYKFDGPYVGRSSGEYTGNGPANKVSDKGIVSIKVGDQFYSNPVTSSVQAYIAYGKFLKTGQDADKARLLNIADWLITQLDDRGALRYDYSWDVGWSKPMTPPWTSALAQGQALSVFSRAYTVTKDRKYLDAGDKAYAYLTLPIEEGGVKTSIKYIDPSLENWVFFEEYPQSLPAYTLNGYIFTLIGLYDWSKTSANTQIRNDSLRYVRCGAATLSKILPYYDIGGVSSYDMKHMVVKGVIPNLNTAYPQQLTLR